jgi:exo-beta-1,3-glucanase (GH17 family)
MERRTKVELWVTEQGWPEKSFAKDTAHSEVE